MTSLAGKIVCVAACFGVICHASPGSDAETKLALNGAQMPSSATQANRRMKTISLPHFEPDLPFAEGRTEFMIVCVSCHSPRYVTMQPPFPQRKWEEIVDKMVKVYGAQIDTNQRQAAIEYLVAINSNKTQARGSAPAGQDEDDFGAAANARPAQAEAAPILEYATDGGEHVAELKRGAELFQQNCAGCHGTTGTGGGVVSEALLRKPENLTASRYSLHLLSQVLWNGKAGTAMPSWRNLGKRDLAALAVYVQTLHKPTQPAPASPEAMTKGKTLFLQTCSPCHGALADGKGNTGLTLFPPPADFKNKQPDFDYILEVLKDGIVGTAMPSWKEQLTENDRAAVAGYVRSIFPTTSLGD